MKKFKILKLISFVLAGYTLLGVSSQGMASEYLPLNSEATVLEQVNTKDESVEVFIQKIEHMARKLSKENDLYLSVIIAQAILESAAGKSNLAQAPNYNLFGIKESLQDNDDSPKNQDDVHSKFRQYSNYEESLTDYVHVLKDGVLGNPDFYSGAWKSNTNSYKEATRFLKGRYAIDPQYDQKLNTIIDMYNINDLDDEVTTSDELAISNAEVTPSVQIENDSEYQLPLKNFTVSSNYGMRNGEFHRGIDFAAMQGEPIYASIAGRVIEANFHSSWGNYVVIEHIDGSTTLYAHQQKYIVKVGQNVEQAQLIGYVGSTGNSTGPHLHFEICLDNSLSPSKLVDPAVELIK